MRCQNQFIFPPKRDWLKGAFPFLPFRLFEEHSELILLFEKFRELKTKEQQATSEELAEHANKVMETLDEGIRSLDELDVFFQYLHDVGASHTRIPGFSPEHFWVSYWFSLKRCDILARKDYFSWRQAFNNLIATDLCKKIFLHRHYVPASLQYE